MNDVPPGAQSPASEPVVPDFTADRAEEDVAASVVAAQDAGGPPLQWPLVLVLTGLLTALLIVATDHFRRGSVLFAAVVVFAFFLRAFLPERDAGWLAVRSRRIDLLCLGFLGFTLLVFSLIVPSPS